jgi:hypothetical protein
VESSSLFEAVMAACRMTSMMKREKTLVWRVECWWELDCDSRRRSANTAGRMQAAGRGTRAEIHKEGVRRERRFSRRALSLARASAVVRPLLCVSDMKRTVWNVDNLGSGGKGWIGRKVASWLDSAD